MTIAPPIPHRVVSIRVPLLGLSERQELEAAALAIGAHVTTNQVNQRAEWVQFRFASEAHAATFRTNALDIAGALVEPAERAARRIRNS